MNSFMKPALDTYFSDVQAKIEVYDIVREMVDEVEIWDMENNLNRTSKTLELTQQLNEAIVSRIKNLHDRNTCLSDELTKIKQGAITTREVFVKDIGHFLSENKQVQKLKDKISELETRLNNYALHGTDVLEDETPLQEDGEPAASDETNSEVPEGSVDANAPLSSVVSISFAEKKKERQEQQMFLYDLDDEFLLNVFSYLETVEVLHVAEICKYAFKRVVVLFQMDSSVAVPEWGIRPDRRALQNKNKTHEESTRTPERSVPKLASSGSLNSDTPDRKPAVSSFPFQVANATPVTAPTPPPAEGPGLTKEIIDVLIKKLTPTELTVIMSVAERLKKQTAQALALTAEKEDLTARLENTESVRNFLIEKLKAAEQEIKALMSATAALKKQAVSDQEIIGYLDLRVNELEGQKSEYILRCQQLQASLDLQYGSHSHKEQQLSTELNEWKLKYEKLDANFKAQKKVLVKEVKTLRSQVDAMTTERSLHTNQFRLLREALSLGGGSTGAGLPSSSNNNGGR